MRMIWSSAAAVWLLAAAACSGEPGRPDAGPLDAGRLEIGPGDVGPASGDAAEPTRDAGGADSGAPESGDGGRPTWYAQIKPLVARRCGDCHGAALRNGAPFSLMSYLDVTAEVRSGRTGERGLAWAFIGRAVVDQRAPMPPLGVGSALERSEIDLITAWVGDGAPEGTPPPVRDPLDETGPPRLVVDNLADAVSPTWVESAGRLVFAERGRDRVLALSTTDITTVRANVGAPSGLATTPTGDLWVAARAERALSRGPWDAAPTSVVSNFEGAPLGGPVDVIAPRGGSIVYFIDGGPVGGAVRVFSRLSESGTLTQEWVATPGASPERLVSDFGDFRLLLSDSASDSVLRFGLLPDGHLGPPVLFARTGPEPRGMALDRLGRVFVATTRGVEVFDASGAALRVITLPEVPVDLGWGGSDRKTLFVSTGARLYRLEMAVSGLND